MNRNQLKILACISMAIDHIGYIIFPDIFAFRVIGRIAMPVFAFFIGEGCIHTKDRKKYFLRVFILALICQAVNIAESIITKSGNALYLNILFTFSFSVILCCAGIDFKKKPDLKRGIIFLSLILTFYFMNLFFEKSSVLTGVNITLDYGFGGICLPLFSALITDRRRKLILYGAGILSFMLFSYGLSEVHIIMGIITAALLFTYNGQAGQKNLKYFFYLFYPLHLAAIYLINIITDL